MTTKRMQRLYNEAPKHVRALVQILLDPSKSMRRRVWTERRGSICFNGQRFIDDSPIGGPVDLPNPAEDWYVLPRKRPR